MFSYNKHQMKKKEEEIIKHLHKTNHVVENE